MEEVQVSQSIEALLKQHRTISFALTAIIKSLNETCLYMSNDEMEGIIEMQAQLNQMAKNIAEQVDTLYTKLNLLYTIQRFSDIEMPEEDSSKKVL